MAPAKKPTNPKNKPINTTQETTTTRMTLTKNQADKIATAARNAREWTAKRDALITNAIDAGCTLREVGNAAGLSHTAIKFIARGRAPSG